MKTLKFAFLALIVSAFMACGSDKSAPEAVKTAFDSKFPEASDVKWDLEKENEWEAEFQLEGKILSKFQ